MKFGNKRIPISLIEIIGFIVAIVGVVFFFILEDSLFKILCLCVTAMCILGLFIKFNTKFNSIVTNQYSPTIQSKSPVSHSVNSSVPEDFEGNFEEIQIHNRGFVIVNRSAAGSSSNSSQPVSSMHSYEMEEAEEHQAEHHSYKIVPAEDVPSSEPQPITQASSTANTSEPDSILEMETEEEPLIAPVSETETNNATTDAQSSELFENVATEPVDIPAPELSQTQDINAKIVEDANSVNDNTFIKEENAKIQEVVESALEETKYNVELHISDMQEIAQRTNPSLHELNSIIAKLLVLIAEKVRYTTAGLVWVNHEKQTLLLGNCVCDNAIKDILHEKFPLKDNVFSEITSTGSPLFLTEKYHPDIEQQYFPYHLQPVGIKSFIGIPITHNNAISAILFVDSDKYKYSESNEYTFMCSLVSVFSHLISFYDNNIHNENAAEILGVMNDFSAMITERGGSFNDICASIINFALKRYACTSIGIVTYNTQSRKWAISAYSSKEQNIDKQFLNDPVIDINKTLVGSSILKSQLVLLASVPQGFVRVNEYEPNLINGSFISIPIKSTTVCYGALFIESYDNSFIKNINVKILETICNQAGELFERLKWMRLFDNYVEVEINTGILTKNAFNRKISSEIARATDSGTYIVLVLVSLDEYSYFSDSFKKSQVLQYVIELLKAQLKPFEIIGRVQNNVVGLLLFNRNVHHVKLMMEAINRKVASQYIEIQKEKLSATISVGISECTKDDTWLSFTTNATATLKLAQKKTNTVEIF